MRTRTSVRSVFGSLLALLALAVVLTACGTEPTAVTITVTSHADGDRITGSRSVTLSGTLSGGPVTAFEVTLNGTAVGAATHGATGFDAPLTLDDGANVLTITATSGAGTTSESLTPTYPFLALGTFTPASTVIGQPDPTSRTPALTSFGLQFPYGDPALVQGVLYVPDTVDNRVLGFTSGVPTADGAAADVVLGQPGFTSDTAGSTATGLDTPQSVTGDGGMLYVVDYNNSRVLVYRP